ncbi:hypothetical protein EG835_07925 [bacterium]|nr:hypothetical protein [bacterium]
MRTGAVIQARTSSTRLPGKVLLELPTGSGVPVLRRVIDRVREAESLDTVIVATSVGAEDDPVAEIAAAAGVGCFRGQLDDVLGRYVGAVDANGLDRVVRITADCPCVDPDIIDAVVALQTATGAELCTNVVPRSWPKGLDVEMATADVLRRLDAMARTGADREHVFTYMYQTAVGQFEIANLPAPEELFGPEVRVTLDTQADFEILEAAYRALGPSFRTAELMRFLGR